MLGLHPAIAPEASAIVVECLAWRFRVNAGDVRGFIAALFERPFLYGHNSIPSCWLSLAALDRRGA